MKNGAREEAAAEMKPNATMIGAAEPLPQERAAPGTSSRLVTIPLRPYPSLYEPDLHIMQHSSAGITDHKKLKSASWQPVSDQHNLSELGPKDPVKSHRPSAAMPIVKQSTTALKMCTSALRPCVSCDLFMRHAPSSAAGPDFLD